jgi:hypothetical protein
MHVRLRGCMWMLWQIKQKGFNHQTWHWMNIDIMPFTFHHGELQFSHNVFISSKWTQRIKFLMNFIALHWTTLLVRLQLHSSSTSKRVLWVHIFMLKVCKNASQLVLWPTTEYTIRGKVVASTKSRPWWILWVWSCMWFILAPKVL